MKAKLTKFYEADGKTHLSVGYVQVRDLSKEQWINGDAPYYAQRADGQEKWFWDNEDAWDFLTEGLIPPDDRYTF